MPDPTWPPGESGNPFPQLACIGARQSFGSGVVYSETSWGPGQRRRKGTRQREFHSTPLELTGAQLYTFNTWFEQTLLNGTLPFTWTNPFTGLPARYVFKEDMRPEFELVSPAKNVMTPPDETGGHVQRHYTTTLHLELIL